jgi:starch synthase
MHILHLSSELACLVKVGGLGDALLGMARVQAVKGHSVTVILPYYQNIQTDSLKAFRLLDHDLWFAFDGARFGARVWEGFLDQVRVLLLELLHPHQFFQRPNVYGYEDDPARFLAFNCAALAWLSQNPSCDILHLHDWPSAAASVLKTHFKLQTPTLLTLHNVEHQAKASSEVLGRASLESSMGSSLLEIGIRFANGISAVSKTYLEEIQTAEGGRGLDGLLRHKLSQSPSAGIINGIDESYWDTQSSLLSQPFDSTLVFKPGQSQCESKRANKHRLQEELALEISDSPLVVCVTRLVPQKGLDLIEQALYRTLEKGGQFALLGTSPIESVQNHFQRLAQHLQHSTRARILLTYSEKLALNFFAAADLVLIPSLFEPCGLTQLIGFRFGALAIARETGGLKDTVIDLEHHPKAAQQGNGFTFLYPDFKGIGYAVDRALASWNHPQKWNQWVQRVAHQDVSWKIPAQQYEKLYQEVLGSATRF